MKAILKPFFGAWVVEVGTTIFPKLFTDKKQAVEVVETINKKKL